MRIFTRVVRELYVDTRMVVEARYVFFGTALFLVGFFSFASDRYCDGTATTYVACTNPSTFYYYPWWAVGMMVVGAMSLWIWYFRREMR
jgi:O-antigen/teichoic acid export membrane protein